MFTLSVSYIYNTLRYWHTFVALEFIEELLIKSQPQIWYKGFISFLVKTLSGVCVLCYDWNHNHTIVQEHVHRVYTVILGLKFIYKSTCMQPKFGMYITDMHMCKLSFTHLMRTRRLCTRASTSSIWHAHTCIYASEMKNVSYRVHGPHMFSQG